MSNEYRKDFPLLQQEMNGHPLVYLDNGATTQKPAAVIDAVNTYYSRYNANPHRGAYDLSVKATDLYEHARKRVKTFINARHGYEIVFTKNASESLNLLAYSFYQRMGHSRGKKQTLFPASLWICYPGM